MPRDRTFMFGSLLRRAGTGIIGLPGSFGLGRSTVMVFTFISR
jgi:hypothetical protein